MTKVPIPQRIVRADFLGGGDYSGCIKFAAYWPDYDAEMAVNSPASLAQLKAAGYGAIELRMTPTFTNYVNVVDMFISDIYAGGLKVIANLEPVIAGYAGNFDHTSPVSAYDALPIEQVPVPSGCNHWDRYARYAGFAGNQQPYTPDYPNAPTYDLQTMGDVIDAFTADPRIGGFSTESGYHYGMQWMYNHAHPANKYVIWYWDPVLFCVDSIGGLHYPANWNGLSCMGHGFDDIEYRMPIIDGIIPDMYSIYSYMITYGGHEYPFCVSLLQTLPYFRSEFPDMQMSIISETFRQSWSWWSDAINTINWVHGTNLSQNAAIGDNHIHVASTTGFSNGQTVKIHDSTVGNFETMVISTVGTLVLNFTSTLTKAYTTAHTANVFDPAISMGWDGELDEGYLGLDGMLGRANRYLYAQKMALGGTVDFVVLSNQSQGFITSVPEQIALIESINALEPVPNKTVTTVLS